VSATVLAGLLWLGPGEDQIKISGGGRYADGKGIGVRGYSTFPSLIRFTGGTLLCYDRVSKDGGRTWARHRDFSFPLADATRPRRGASVTLKNGTILLVGRYARKHEREAGVYVAEVYRSTDDFASYSGPKRGLIHVPNVVAGTDQYGQPVGGPIFEHSIVELPNGDLVAGMWGWFAEDQTPVDYPDRWKKWRLKKSRVLLVKSTDGGDTWRYVTTVASDPDLGPEGFRFPGLALLPSGELLCLMRNGDGAMPLWLGRSKDGGLTWSKPEKIDVGAAYGDLLILSDGTVLLVYGKPGLWVIASTDGGRTWDLKNRAAIGTRSSVAFIGRAVMAETSPRRVVCVYHDRMDLHARILTISRQ